MENIRACTHSWNIGEEEIIQRFTQWCESESAPQENIYISKFAIHIWDVVQCSKCGVKKLFSSVFDKTDYEKIPDIEFAWLMMFITQMNTETGHIDAKKELINNALDQMHWEYFPYVILHNPTNNYFSISYKNNEFLRYNWSFHDAARMFREMNDRAKTHFAPKRTEELNQRLEQLDQLKQQYRSLMELSSQARISSELEREIQLLSERFESLSKELKELL